jgi:6-pyruvoyltetrahydropterin/6-carboxytetrahydropterin synthase
MYSISKLFCFEASHELPDLPDDHPCKHLHGHSYKVVLELRSDRLDAYGFVIDFAQMTPFGNHIAEFFDHHHLNDVLEVTPTSEHIALHLHELAQIYFPHFHIRVCVSETQKTWAIYEE